MNCLNCLNREEHKGCIYSEKYNVCLCVYPFTTRVGTLLSEVTGIPYGYGALGNIFHIFVNGGWWVVVGGAEWWISELWRTEEDRGVQTMISWGSDS